MRTFNKMTPWAGWLVAGAGVLAGARPAAALDEVVLVRGRVTDAVSGAPVAGAEVVAGEKRGVTDGTGAFEIGLTQGSWTLTVRAANYLDETRRLSVAEAPPPSLEIAVVPKARFSEHVDVSAGPPTDGPGALPVSPDRVMTVAGGLDNVFHVIQTMPGVVATDELGSRLAVRGGGPDENLTIMDGVEIHNPYRLFGLTSAFNPETVARFDFSAGGFGVAHGDRLSSLLVVDNRDGNGKSKLAGSSALSITDANVVLEGKLPAVKKGSWLFTTRRTYYDLVAERFVDVQLPAFRDVQFRAAWEPGEGRKLVITGVRSREDGDGDFEGDVPDENGEFLLGVRNDVVSAAFSARLGPVSSNTTLAWYNNASVFDAAATFRTDTRRSNSPLPVQTPVTSIALQLHHDIRDFSLRQELSRPIGPRHSVGMGFDVHRLDAGITYGYEGDSNPSAANGSSVQGGAGLPERLESGNNYVRGGVWLEDRFRVTDGLTVVPGLRLDASGMSPGQTMVSPRLSATLGLGKSTRLRAAAGRYAQSPGYEKLIFSDYVVDQVDLDFERARHFTLGLEWDLFRGFAARAEVYYKGFDRLIVGRLETEEERQARVARYDYPPELQSDIPTDPLVTSFPTNDGRGESYGLDLYVTRSGAHLSGWLSYTLGWAHREAYGLRYPFDYDRRHSLTVVGSYRFSPKFELSFTARAASGFPWTPYQGSRVASMEQDSRLVPEYDGQGRLVYEVAAGGLDFLNSARLPFYARLDLRAAFRPRGEKGRWQFYVEAINATRRQNTASVEAELRYDPDSDRPQLVGARGGGLPLLPTFGVRFRFE